jgi:hypothetical protein
MQFPMQVLSSKDQCETRVVLVASAAGTDTKELMTSYGCHQYPKRIPETLKDIGQ